MGFDGCCLILNLSVSAGPMTAGWNSIAPTRFRGVILRQLPSRLCWPTESAEAQPALFQGLFVHIRPLPWLMCLPTLAPSPHPGTF